MVSEVLSVVSWLHCYGPEMKPHHRRAYGRPIHFLVARKMERNKVEARDKVDLSKGHSQ